MDQASRTRLSKVHPELARRVEKTIDALTAAGLDVRVVQGLRTYEEQNALFAQGRSRKGPKVTKARGGQSNHNFGLAVDLCPFDDGAADWDNDRAFTLIGAAGKAQGLEWGGDWSSFPDRPHLQLRTGLKTAKCHELYMHGGLTQVWHEANAKLGLKKTADEPVKLELPEPKVAAAASPEEASGHASTGVVQDNALSDEPAPNDQSSPANQPAAAPAVNQQPTELRKERPSTFVKIGAAAMGFFAMLNTIGISVQAAADRAFQSITPGQIVMLVVGLGIGAAAIWMYDRAAQRSNGLNSQKIAAAADPTVNTVELTQ